MSYDEKGDDTCIHKKIYFWEKVTHEFNIISILIIITLSNLHPDRIYIKFIHKNLDTEGCPLYCAINAVKLVVI